jgi:hypothetical protein
VTIGATANLQARGGDGQTTSCFYSANYFAHAGGGGASGGTIYIASDVVNIAPVTDVGGTNGATFDMRGGLGGGRRSQNQYASCMAYPEYMSIGSYGGNGGYGRLAIDYKTSLNSGRQLANRWGLEQTTVDSTSNTFKALAGTARFFCPGMTPAGNIGRSKWYDLKSVSPTLSTFAATTVNNVSVLTLRVEGAREVVVKRAEVEAIRGLRRDGHLAGKQEIGVGEIAQDGILQGQCIGGSARGRVRVEGNDDVAAHLRNRHVRYARNREERPQIDPVAFVGIEIRDDIGSARP